MRPFLAALALCAALPAAAQTVATSAGAVEVVPVVTGLEEPWSVGFLPKGGLLVTERDGRLLHVADERVRDIAGVPEVAATGQGGLLDVLVPRDFDQSGEIFLSHAIPQGRGEGTAITRARLDLAEGRLENAVTIFEMSRGSSGGRHFGGRLVEAPDGTLFLTIGDRGDDHAAQDLSRHNGSVIRIHRDGSVPADNPFVGQTGVRPEIWSYGHRNPQGAAIGPDGVLWVNEHGARGGDEVNRVQPGRNYGWPVISYGTHYSGAKIGEGTARDGMEQPLHYWDPSIAPSGMMVYSGKLFPEWTGDIFAGSLKFDYIARLDGSPLTEVEQIRDASTARVRDIREGPDGAIWFLSVIEGTLFRMTPAD